MCNDLGRPALVVAAALGAIAVWWERDRPGPLTDLLDETFDHLAQGLTGPRAADAAVHVSQLHRAG